MKVWDPNVNFDKDDHVGIVDSTSGLLGIPHPIVVKLKNLDEETTSINYDGVYGGYEIKGTSRVCEGGYAIAVMKPTETTEMPAADQPTPIPFTQMKFESVNKNTWAFKYTANFGIVDAKEEAATAAAKADDAKSGVLVKIVAVLPENEESVALSKGLSVLAKLVLQTVDSSTAYEEMQTTGFCTDDIFVMVNGEVRLSQTMIVNRKFTPLKDGSNLVRVVLLPKLKHGNFIKNGQELGSARLASNNLRKLDATKPTNWPILISKVRADQYHFPRLKKNC